MSGRPFSDSRYICFPVLLSVLFGTFVFAASPSKLDWYLLFKKQSRTGDDPMDRQLFGLSRRVTVSGRVFSQRSGRPVGKASVRVFKAGGGLMAETRTRSDGFFSLKMAPDTPVIVRVRHRWYSSQQKSFSQQMLRYPLLIPLLPSYYATLQKGNKITVYDTSGKVSLSVHADVLKRLDNKPVRFPVRIRISYIDPEKDLDAMPGREMLCEDAGGRLSPLLSYGAALIEAFDAGGNRIVADPQRMRRLNKPTELRFNMEHLVSGRNIRPADLSFKPWQMYPGSSVWKPFPGKVEPVYTRKRQEQGGYLQTIWKTSVLIRAVELIAFNLDAPAKAIPLLFTFRQRGGRGKFVVSVYGFRAKGKFEVTQFFNTDRKAYFRLLVPEVRFLQVAVYTKPGQKIPLVRRRIVVPGRSRTFRFNKKKEIRTVNGRKPVWNRVRLIVF